jgi:hypothetical protein
MTIPKKQASRINVVITASCIAIAIVITVLFVLNRNSRREPSSDTVSRERGRSNHPELPSVKSSDESLDFFMKKKGRLSIEDGPRLAHTKMTPIDAQKLLERIKAEITSTTDRAKLSCCVLRALCAQGYSTEAWALIDQNPGVLRDMEIGTVFLTSKETLDSLVHRLNELSDPKERSQALQGIIHSRPLEIINLDFGSITLGSTSEKNAVAQAIATMIAGYPGSPPDPATSRLLLEKSIDLLKTHNLDAVQLAIILDQDTVNNVYDQWKLLAEIKDSVTPKELERLQSTVVPNMIASDADRSMALICSDPSTKYSVPILSRAVEKMYNDDPQNANTWITTNLPTLDPRTGQRIIGCVAQVAIRSGEYNTAQQWANQLLNPDVKKQVVGQIEAAQKPKVNSKP